jgi:hypothetical protein
MMDGYEKRSITIGACGAQPFRGGHDDDFRTLFVTNLVPNVDPFQA